MEGQPNAEAGGDEAAEGAGAAQERAGAGDRGIEGECAGGGAGLHVVDLGARAGVGTRGRRAAGLSWVTCHVTRRVSRADRRSAVGEFESRTWRHGGCLKTGGMPCKQAREGALPFTSTLSP